jgi:hypothetical protein
LNYAHGRVRRIQATCTMGYRWDVLPLFESRIGHDSVGNQPSQNSRRLGSSFTMPVCQFEPAWLLCEDFSRRWDRIR